MFCIFFRDPEGICVIFLSSHLLANRKEHVRMFEMQVCFSNALGELANLRITEKIFLQHPGIRSVVSHMLSSVLKTDSVCELFVSSLVNPHDRPTHGHKKI